MGYYGKLDLKLKAQSLRKEGLSYKEILKHVHVSKDTLSRWCEHITLTTNQQNRLILKRKNGGLTGAFKGSQTNRRNKLLQQEELLQSGINEIGTMSVREQFFIGIALYVSEGTKSDHIFEFTNADQYLIQFMSKWVRSYCNIDESRLRGAIWLHEGNDEVKAKEYWSHISGVPIEQFQKTYIVKKRSSNKIRKNFHKYGIFLLRISDVRVTRRLMGWICGIFSESWYNNKVKERFPL